MLVCLKDKIQLKYLLEHFLPDTNVINKCRNAGQICIPGADQIQDYIVHFDNLMEVKTCCFNTVQ